MESKFAPLACLLLPVFYRDKPMTHLFDLPFISAGFFILAGILIGHLLWYRDRSVDADKINGLESRYFKARGSARQRKREVLKIRKMTASQATDLGRTLEEYDQLLAQKNSLEESHRKTSVELTRLQRDKQQSDELLAAEQKRNTTVVAQLQEVLQSKATTDRELSAKSTAVAQLETELQAAQAGLEANVQANQQLQTTIAELTQSQEAKDAAINAAHLQVADLNQTLQAKEASMSASSAELAQTIQDLQNQIAELTSSQELTTQELKDTQQDLVARCEDLDTLRSEREAIEEQLRQASEQISNLDAELSLLQNAKVERDEFAVDLEAAANSMAQQRQTLESREADIVQLNEQLQILQQEWLASKNQIVQHERDREAMSSSLTERETAMSRLQSELQSLLPLRAEVAKANAELADHQSVVAEQTAQLQTLQASLQELQGELAAKVATVQQQSTQQAALQQRLAELEPLQGELVLAGETIAQLTRQAQHIPGLEKRLGETNQHLLAIREDNAQKAANIQELTATIEQLQGELSTFETTKADLEAMSKEFVTVANQRDQLVTTHGELQATLKTLQNQVSSQNAKIKEVNELLSAKSKEYADSAAALQHELKTQSVAVGDLRAQLAERTQQHQSAIAEVASVRQTLSKQHAAIERLTSELKEAEKLRPVNKTLQDRIADLTAHLKRLSAELEDSLVANAKAEDRVRDVETQLHEQSVKIRELRRERGAIPGFAATDDDNQSSRRAA
jgi:chromosome segregation ATPase